MKLPLERITEYHLILLFDDCLLVAFPVHSPNEYDCDELRLALKVDALAGLEVSSFEGGEDDVLHHRG